MTRRQSKSIHGTKAATPQPQEITHGVPATILNRRPKHNGEDKGPRSALPHLQTFESSAEDAASYEYVETKTITLEEFLGYERNPYQRDERSRAKKNIVKFLRLEAKHLEVEVAVLTDRFGRTTYVKTDGHTRAYVWSGEFQKDYPKEKAAPPIPTHVHCKIYECSNWKQVERLYLLNDNKASVMQARDIAGGAENVVGIRLNSGLFRGKQYSEGLKRAYQSLYGKSGKDDIFYMEHVMRTFREETIALDKCNPTKKDFPTGVLTAAILTISLHGDKIVEFWRRYAQDEGIKDAGGRDAPEALRHTMDEVVRRKSGKSTTRRADTSSAKIPEVMGMCINAVNTYLKNGRYKDNLQGKKSHKMREFFQEVKDQKPLKD